MSKHLRQIRRVSAGAPRKKRPKGWSPERRARQAALIRTWQPWRHSTGPITELGKARCAMNPDQHAAPDDTYALAIHRARKVLRLAARYLAILRALKHAAALRAAAPLTSQESAAIRYSLLAKGWRTEMRKLTIAFLAATALSLAAADLIAQPAARGGVERYDA